MSISNSKHSQVSLQTQLRIWVGVEEIDPATDDSAVQSLYATILELAKKEESAAREAGFNQRDAAEDIPGEFLLSLKRNGNIAIESKKGLERELKRHLNHLRNPARYELWGILSDALWSLSREGKAHRVDKPVDKPNHNNAQWISAMIEEGTAAKVTEMAAFFEAVDRLPSYRPRGAKKWYPPGADVPKIISPTDAQDLVEKLLVAAGGVILFIDLLGAFETRVFVFQSLQMEDSSPQTDDSSLQMEDAAPSMEDLDDSIHPVAAARIFSVAAGRAEAIWQEVCEKGLAEILCGYFIPKFVRGERVRLEDFGSSSSVGDRVKKLKDILAKHLTREFQDHETVDELHLTLCGKIVLDLLSEKQPEKT